MLTGQLMPKIKTLKSKLIISFSFVLAVISLLLVAYFSYYTSDLLVAQTIENARANTGYQLSVIDQQIKLTEELSDWFYINRDIDKTLIRDYSDPKNNFNLDISNVLKVINNRLTSSSIGKYVTALIIHGNNDVQVTIGAEVDYLDMAALRNYPWFREGIQSFVLKWPGLEINHSKMRASEYALPIARSIIFSDSRKQIGWQYLSFSPDLIGDTVKNYDLADGDNLFVLDSEGRCVFSSLAGYQGQDMAEYDLFNSIIGQSGYLLSEFDGLRYLSVYDTSAYSGLQIVQLINHKSIDEQRRNALRIAIALLLVIIVVGIFTTAFLSQKMTRPLSRLLAQIGLISKGDFQVSPEIEGEDEFGVLGKGVNHLASSVSKLMDELKEDEKKKHELEFKVLQSQINPHFVYNVINSIKVMAMIQKSDGIYQTATSLGALLKEISKGNRDLITMQEELTLLEHYIEIQKIRKNGLIQFVYSIEKDLELCRIPRFTLQPIVENAIIHGFEGKRGMGKITVNVTSDNDDILIEVLDNGNGIPPDKLTTIMKQDGSSQATYSNVGLINIDERIKLLYGHEYGLSITSQFQQFTRVLIRIPKISETAVQNQ